VVFFYCECSVVAVFVLLRLILLTRSMAEIFVRLPYGFLSVNLAYIK